MAPPAAAILVLLVIGAVWAALRLGDDAGAQPGSGISGDPGSPAPLRLAGWLPPGSGEADPRYHLSPGADLPDGPGSGEVRRLDPADTNGASMWMGRAVDPGIEPGAGWVRRGVAGPAYPLVIARSAYEALVRTPLPMPLMACPEPLPPAANPVSCGGPVTVTGARLGLSLQQSADGLVLVPAWLFDVEGSPDPLVQLAVDPSLLRPVPPDLGSGAGGSTGSPGTVSAAPGGPATDVPAAGSRFSSVTRAADDRSLKVTFYGGVPECYSYGVKADETDQQVRLSVLETRTAGDKPCIDLAMEITKTVPLDAPLGLRT
ncbi:MAG TPA: hypothetical protein VNC79_02110, partial [Mycobacteriales bacterium]|nr:hypothetical protein [Mycobacteriales bacterium]